MSNADIPILVVDDAKFSSAIIAKALRGGGFSNVRFTNNPLQALRSLEKRPAQILIADWLMPSMDGLELTRRVKKLDETSEHFTYVRLLTAREDFEAMTEAFKEGVDDFLNKANPRAQLLPRVVAAKRIGAKVRQLVRPLDVVTRPEANMFAVITLQKDIANCTSQSFRRIFDNLYMHSFETSEGHIPVVVGVSISAADSGTGFPQAKHFMRHAYQGLTHSFDTGLITVAQFDPTSDAQS